MRTATRLKLDCAQRVFEFCRHQPDPSPSALEVVARLQQLIGQATALLEQQRIAQTVAATAIHERDAIAGVIRERLAHLVRLSCAAALREREATLRLSVPFGTASYPQFVSAAQDAFTAASAHRGTLVRYGMPEEMLEELGQNLERCQAAQERRLKASAASVAAGADLATVAGETLLTIRHLDALNRLRLAGDPERLAEWEAASSIQWGRRPDRDERSEGADSASVA
jgi:hypothetical protein